MVVVLATQSIEGHQVSTIQACQQLGITPIASAGLGQGDAIDKISSLTSEMQESLSASQFALQFTRSIPGIATALVGMKKPEHVAGNLELVSLSPLQLTAMNSLLNKF